MAGVKISNLKSYDEVFGDEYFGDFVNEMIVPVSLGNKTISVKIKELMHYINVNDAAQDVRLNEQQEQIWQNNELINQLATAVMERIDKLKADADAEHKDIKDTVEENEKVTALSLIDLNQITEEIMLRIHNLKEESDAVHEQMKEQQHEKDASQDERIDSLDDSINLWEIYGENN